MFKPKEKNEDYLKNKIFVGLVEDNLDDKRKGRVKVRVQGVFNEIDVEHIPWASPFRSLDGKSFCVPAIGKIVNVIFPEGNLYDPQYIYSENYNINLSNKLEGLGDDEYKNFVALLFDHRTQIYSDDNSLTLDYLFNKISINDGSINLELKDNGNTITLGTKTADQEAVLGTNFFKWMDGFMQTLLTPTTLTGNFGAPILRPALDQKIMEYQTLRNTFVSQNVFINNNNNIQVLDRGANTNLHDVKFKINGDSLNNKIKSDNKSSKNKSLKNKSTKSVSDPDINKIQDKIKEQTEQETDKTMESSPKISGDPPFGNHIIEEKVIDQQGVDRSKIIDETGIKYDNDSEKTKKESNISSDPEYNPDKEPVDPYAGFWSSRKPKGPVQKQKQEGYGTYTEDSSTTSSSTESASGDYNLDSEIISINSNDEELWKSCGPFFGLKSPFKTETIIRADKLNPNLKKFIEFANIEMKKWDKTYSITGAGGGRRSVEASLITGKKKESQIKSKYPDLMNIIINLRKKYNVQVCTARSMVSNHVVGHAVDTDQIIRGVKYNYANRKKYPQMMALTNKDGVTYKDAMLKTIKKFVSKYNVKNFRWGGTWSCWKSESHHFEINISINERIDLIMKGWETGKKWRKERN